MLNKDDIERTFYKIYMRTIDVKQFEEWLYNVDEDNFVSCFNKELYFELLFLNYKVKHVLKQLDKLIYPKIPFGKYEEENIKHLLRSIIDRSLDMADVLEKMYDLYCGGYSFLRYIGLAYVSNGIDNVPRVGTRKDWSEEEFYRKRSPLRVIENKIHIEAERILCYLESGKIQIICKNEYLDMRDDKEKTESSDYELKYID